MAVRAALFLWWLGVVRLPLGPLMGHNFRLLLVSEVISVLGSAMAQVALPFAVLGIGGSAADVGYVAAAGTVPVVVFLLLGGVVADRVKRQQVMAAANVLEGAAQGSAAALILAGQAQVWMLMVCAAAGGVGLGFYFPAVQGLLPQTVPAAQLAEANAMMRVGRNVSLVCGPALGGVLVGVAGPGWGLAADAGSFVVAALLRVWMHFPAAAVPGKGDTMLRELRRAGMSSPLGAGCGRWWRSSRCWSRGTVALSDRMIIRQEDLSSAALP